jgi:hypothetical protein
MNKFLHSSLNFVNISLSLIDPDFGRNTEPKCPNSHETIGKSMSLNSINQIIEYYREYNEQDRLLSPWGELEYFRTQAILQAHLPASPAVILDVGGATGRYACWLAGLGYTR